MAEKDNEQLNVQLYGSLNEFVPITMESSSAVGRDDASSLIPRKANPHNFNSHKMKQPKVKLIERRKTRPQSASTLNGRNAQRRERLQYEQNTIGSYGTSSKNRRNQQRPRTARSLNRRKKRIIKKHEISIRPPSPAKQQTRLRAKKKRNGNNGNPTRRKILAERIVEEEKKKRQQEYERLKYYKAMMRPSSPQTDYNDRSNNNYSKDEPRKDDDNDTRLERPRSPTPSSMHYTNNSTSPTTTVEINAQLLQLEFDAIKESNRQKKEIKRHEMFRDTYSMIHRGITSNSPRVSPSRAGGGKINTSSPPQNHATASIPQYASAIQHDKLSQSIGVETIKTWNIKKDSIVNPSTTKAPLQSAQVTLMEMRKRIDEINRIKGVYNQQQKQRQLESAKSIEFKKNKQANSLKVVGNKTTTMRELENVHFDSRRKQYDNRLVYGGGSSNNGGERRKKQRPRTATSNQTKQKLKIMDRKNQRRPKSASTASRRNIMTRFKGKQVTNPVLRQMYSPRYRHIVYSVPITQNRMKDTFQRISEIEVKPDLTKNRATNLRVSANANSYQIYRAVSSQRNSKYRSNEEEVKMKASQSASSRHNPHSKINPKKPQVSKLHASLYYQHAMNKPSEESPDLKIVPQNAPRIVYMNKLIENNMMIIDKSNDTIGGKGNDDKSRQKNAFMPRPRISPRSFEKYLYNKTGQNKETAMVKASASAKIKKRPQSARPRRNKNNGGLDIYTKTIVRVKDTNFNNNNDISQTSEVLRDQAFEEYKKMYVGKSEGVKSVTSIGSGINV